MDLGIASAEAFGQSEALTTRCGAREHAPYNLLLRSGALDLPYVIEGILHHMTYEKVYIKPLADVLLC